MRKTLILSAILSLIAVSLSAQTSVGRRITCESIDGRRAHCPADTSGGVQLVQRLSSSDCESNRDWGYDRNGIWVDNGCRAEFLALPNAWETVVCESTGRRRTRCAATTRYGIELARKLSDSDCTRGRTWGFDAGGIWVSGGCRAEFRVMRQPAVHLPGGVTVLCESDGGRKHCAADTSGGVTLARQVSDSSCVQGRSWGVTSTGVWVDEGCRAEFTIGTASTAMERRITCESLDGRRANCPADASGDVKLVQRLSSSDCDFNRDWGYDRNGIWVDNGCRAEFVVRGRAMDLPVFGTLQGTVTCESIDGKRKLCAADTRYGVSLYRQLSNSDCTRRTSWGTNRQGIWVDHGCRGEFLLRRP